MPPSTRRNVELTDRRRRVAEMYLAGKMQTEIAEAEGVDTATISRDLKAIRGEWRASTLLDFNEAQNRELAKIDALEAENWRAWRRSIGTHTTVKVERKEIVPLDKEGDAESGLGQVVNRSETSTPLVGDPRFLAGVQWCISERCKVLGIYAPTKGELTGAGGKPISITTMTLDQWKQQQGAAMQQAKSVMKLFDDDDEGDGE